VTRILAAVGAVVLTLVAADMIGRVAAADHYRVQARDTLNDDAVEALRLANRALALNDRSVPAHVIKSAAYARLGDYGKARGTLRAAATLEPSDPLPWMLLGDLAVRRGDVGAARRAYERALELNPKDGLLPSLVADPRSALPPEE
jgi:tetratricopeptide (TPR) repeat protein